MKIGLRELNDVTKKYKELLLKDIESKAILLEKVEECICCKNKKFEKLLDVDRFDLPFGSYICKDCGLVTTSPRIKQESLPYYYEKYYHPINYGKESLENQTALFKEGQGKKIFDKLKPYIKAKSKLSILEIGAGVGNVLDEFKVEATIKNIEVDLLGTEYSDECIIQCEKKNISTIKGNAETILTTGKTFDLIILSHVFEHFIDLNNELTILKKLLDKDGLLYIEVPGILDIHDKEYYDFSFLGYSVHAHMYNFSLKTLTNVAQNNNFTLLEGNEEVTAIFQQSETKKITSQNSSVEILKYLDYLKNDKIIFTKIFTKLNKDIEKYKTQVENRNKDIEKYKTQVENRNKDIEKYKTQVENKNNENKSLKDILMNIQKSYSKIKSISIIQNPHKKYKAYTNLMKEINATKS